MLTYSNDPDLKAAFVAEVKRHTDLDHLIKGSYGDETVDSNWRGCALGGAAASWGAVKGVTIVPSDHAALERHGLYPEWLARLEDTIFEALPHEKAMAWPLRLSTAIPVGADLEPVKWRFCAFLMQENIDRVVALDVSDALKEQVVGAIRGVLAIHEAAIVTGKWSESSAESAAWSAAWSSAWSARSAAESAARSARSAAYERYADKIIELLAEA